ncbi:peptidylprolyl isomerase [Candidatus Parcubacteria bacterium]|nr:MAG: peptidylprolyl isomerase [Candidatus Parcubacteria bacterium]
MKNIPLILILLFTLSACATTNLTTEKNAPENLNNYNDSELVQKIGQLSRNSSSENTTNSDSLSNSFNGAILKTNLGDIKVKFFSEESPNTVNNFLQLAKSGFYDKTKFHRVISGFMIQGGDPNSKDDNWADDGTGGPGYKFADEFNSKKLVAGNLAMANSGPNTNGSQFFIVTAQATPWLDGRHTNFGEVVEGMPVVKMIEAVKTNERDHPMDDVIINSIELINIK